MRRGHPGADRAAGREGWTAEDCGTAFPVAAAWLALAGLRTGRERMGYRSPGPPER